MVIYKTLQGFVSIIQNYLMVCRTCESFVSSVQNHLEVCRPSDGFVLNIENLLVNCRTSVDFASYIRNSRRFSRKYTELPRIPCQISETFWDFASNIQNPVRFCIKHMEPYVIYETILDSVQYSQNFHVVLLQEYETFSNLRNLKTLCAKPTERFLLHKT